MKPSKYITTSFLFLIILISLTSIGFTLGGYKTDPTGDAGVLDVDIVRLDVEGNLLKITLAKTPEINESEHTWYTYNIFVDCDGSTTPALNPDVYEYVGHFKWYYSGGQWYNDSYLMCTRFWVDSDHDIHEDGQRFWNKVTETWQVSDPDQQTADVSGNTISFDITTALYRIHFPQFYFFQAFATSGKDLQVNDTAPNTGWVDENSGAPPYSPNPSATLPSISILLSLTLISVVTISVKFIRKKK
jgi:hypothetical protein